MTDVGFTAELEKQLDQVASGRAGMRPLLDGFYGKLRGELSGAEGDPSFTPPKPAVVEWPCPNCGGPTAVLLERGRLVLACRTCPDPAELSWAPKKARRSAAKKESSEKAASEQAAADQRLQARCGECGGPPAVSSCVGRSAQLSFHARRHADASAAAGSASVDQQAEGVEQRGAVFGPDLFPAVGASVAARESHHRFRRVAGGFRWFEEPVLYKLAADALVECVFGRDGFMARRRLGRPVLAGCRPWPFGQCCGYAGCSDDAECEFHRRVFRGSVAVLGGYRPSVFQSGVGAGPRARVRGVDFRLLRTPDRCQETDAFWKQNRK